MLTFRAKYRNGQVSFIDPISFSGEYDILVTFLTSNDKILQVSNEEIKQLKTIIRQKG
jgi:hypothetical protein